MVSSLCCLFLADLREDRIRRLLWQGRQNIFPVGLRFPLESVLQYRRVLSRGDELVLHRHIVFGFDLSIEAGGWLMACCCIC